MNSVFTSFLVVCLLFAPLRCMGSFPTEFQLPRIPDRFNATITIPLERPVTYVFGYDASASVYRFDSYGVPVLPHLPLSLRPSIRNPEIVSKTFGPYSLYAFYFDYNVHRQYNAFPGQCTYVPLPPVSIPPILQLDPKLAYLISNHTRVDGRDCVQWRQSYLFFDIDYYFDSDEYQRGRVVLAKLLIAGDSALNFDSFEEIKTFPTGYFSPPHPCYPES